MNPVASSVWIWRIGLGLAAVVLLWRMVILGIADHHRAEIPEQGVKAAEKALTWNASESKALYVSAAAALPEQPSLAADLARKALRSDPADGVSLLVLANAHLLLGELEEADRYAQQAELLMPSKGSVRLGLAE